MPSDIFINGQTLVVTAIGPGKLHLFSYQSKKGYPDIVGAVTTSKAGETRFLISHTYSYQRFAFHWEGAGEAVYGIGASLRREWVGPSWKNASLASWGSAGITMTDVSIPVQRAEKLPDNQITAFVIPDFI